MSPLEPQPPTLDDHIVVCEEERTCPWCGSDDLDDFTDGTGAFCMGCLSNIFRDERGQLSGDPALY